MIFQEDMVQRKGKRLQRLLPDSRFQLAFPDDDGMPSISANRCSTSWSLSRFLLILFCQNWIFDFGTT